LPRCAALSAARPRRNRSSLPRCRFAAGYQGRGLRTSSASCRRWKKVVAQYIEHRVSRFHQHGGLHMESKQLIERRKAAVARGVGTRDIYAVRAENAELWTAEGRRMLDF